MGGYDGYAGNVPLCEYTAYSRIVRAALVSQCPPTVAFTHTDDGVGSLYRSDVFICTDASQRFYLLPILGLWSVEQARVGHTQPPKNLVWSHEAILILNAAKCRDTVVGTLQLYVPFGLERLAAKRDMELAIWTGKAEIVTTIFLLILQRLHAHHRVAERRTKGIANCSSLRTKTFPKNTQANFSTDCCSCAVGGKLRCDRGADEFHG